MTDTSSPSEKSPCCGALKPDGSGFMCCRQPGHIGVHVATTDEIVAEWGEDGALPAHVVQRISAGTYALLRLYDKAYVEIGRFGDEFNAQRCAGLLNEHGQFRS